MSENELPVTVAVRRPDGGVEHVRVGTATRTADGFSVKLFELTIGEGAAAQRSPPAARAQRPAASPSGPAPTVFPNYGRSKGAPIAGANRQDLEFYATGARRTLSDPGKARFHDKERALLAAIEAELGRQGGGQADDEPPPHGDGDRGPDDE
jgi:hypothetical protein